MISCGLSLFVSENEPLLSVCLIERLLFLKVAKNDILPLFILKDDRMVRPTVS